jgi:tetratricopeptide (TPR) repeat protein
MADEYNDTALVRKSITQYREILEVMKQYPVPDVEMLQAIWIIGVSYIAQNEIDSSLKYLEKASSYETGDLNLLAQKYRAVMWLGSLYFSLDQTEKAIALYQEAVNWYDDTGVLYWAMYASNILGHEYYLMEDLDNSERYFLKAQTYFNTMLQTKSWYRNDSLKYITFYGFEIYFPLPSIMTKEMMWNLGQLAYEGLYRIYETRNQTAEALKYHILYTRADDTLEMIHHQKETLEIQTLHETEQKEKQIEFLSRENEFKSLKLRQSRTLLFGLIGFVTMIILLAIMLIRQNRIREQQNNMILKEKLFRTQMNPHFLFNSLTSIQNYILDEEPHHASKYLSRFSKLIRNILDSSIDEFVSLEREINTIENYLELQKIRFKNRFEYYIEIDEKINLEEANIPPMIAQPFIENSIEHGIKNKAGKGHINIRFVLHDSQITLEIEDDGVGREKAMEILFAKNKGHKSMSTEITHERIRALNRKLNHKIKLDILDLKNDRGEAAGTKVVLQVPLL